MQRGEKALMPHAGMRQDFSEKYNTSHTHLQKTQVSNRQDYETF